MRRLLVSLTLLVPCAASATGMRGRATLVRQLHAELTRYHAATGSHTDRVATNAQAVARALGIASHRARAIGAAALLHDLGKVEVSRSALDGNTLTPADRAALAAHPATGAQLFSPRFPSGRVGRLIEAGILGHHEHWDGTGYPRKLAGTAIPRTARIIAVVDAYDAMTTARGYNKVLNHAQAVAELRRSAGTHFDPDVVEAFVRAVPPAS